MIKNWISQIWYKTIIFFIVKECIVLQNITHWGGGVELWENSYSAQSLQVSDGFFSDTTTVSESNQTSGVTQEKFKQASYCDGCIEGVGFTSMLQMGQVQAGLAKGLRVCQGS